MAAPFVRQAHQSSMDSLTATQTYEIYLPHLSLAGNALFACIEANSSDTISSITDDQSNANWAQIDTQSSGQSGHTWLCTNIAANTQKITITLNASDQFVQVIVGEISGLSTAAVASAVSGHNSATSITSTSISAGALGNASGDMLIQFAYDTSQVEGITFTAGTGWTLLSAQKLTGFVCQYKIATGANETASLTRSAGTRTYNTMAFAVSADSSKGDGTQTAPFIRFQQDHYATPGHAAGFNLQFPSQGDCIFADLWQGDSAKSVSSVSDSINGSWPAAIKTANVTNGQIEAWSAGHCSTSTAMTATVTYSAAISAAASGMMIFKDIVGSASSAIGASASNTGNQTSASSPFNVASVSITPTAVNSLVMGNIIINSHCVAGLTGSNFYAGIAVSPDFDGGDQDLFDCDGSGIYLNGASLGSATFTWTTFNSNASGVGTWGATAVEILVATGTVVSDALQTRAARLAWI
jgi:hypothetical protein